MEYKKTISEAPESSAGDNFHVLWTVKKSFELLNFDDDKLKAITIEGIDPINSKKLDPSGDKLLGVDITEYFGGENFSEAKKVVVSQLKYSTRRVDENWTFSKLYKGKKSGSTDGSVFHRLSQIYITFLEEYGRDLVVKKLSLKLVSNRDLSDRQKKIISSIQSFLKKKQSKTYIASIIKEFPKYKSRLNKLKDVTKLDSIEFTDFLRLLDFEDCGTSSSYYQELEIVKALRNVGFEDLNQSDSLFRMVWRKMLPKAIEERKNKITEIDLLHCLNTNMERLFPVITKFEKIKHLVKRKQVDTIIDEILNNKTGKPICLHGGAGIGKSTTSQMIKENFPVDSEVILFDSYGAGSYLNPSDSRHLHKEAILQISNELAKSIGSPFLLSSNTEPYLLIREFKRRVEYATKILQQRNPDAVLVLIVDAADNSVTAAKKNQTNSFIQHLVNETYCNGFRLVVTLRSHRVSSLNLPINYIDRPLCPFSYEETEKNLILHFPKSTKEEIQKFHTLTNGIPRVQTYALELKKEGIKQVLNYLKPNGKKVGDLIHERIRVAANKLGTNGHSTLDIFFTSLICLPRPVPIQYLEIITELNTGILQDLSTDIWHGLVLDDNNLSFRDEDFENYIRQKYTPTQEIYVKIANLFLEKANNDEYASINLGIVLYEAKYEEKLKDIVLNEKFKKIPTDPIRQKEIYIERTKLAMKVSNNSDDNLTFFKLAFIAADAAKTDAALNNLLINNADLVASFGEADSLEKLHIQSGASSWAGSFHFQLAAIYSRKTNSIELAKRHLKNAQKWVQWLLSQEDRRELNNYRITNQDLANGAEAILRISGSNKAYNWLKRWKPKKGVFKATILLINELLKDAKEEEITQWIKPLNLPIHLKLLILEKIEFSKHLFNLDRIANYLLILLSKKVNFEIYIKPLIISFCELYIKNNPLNKEIVLKILESIKVKLPDYMPSLMGSPYSDDNSNGVNIDLLLRKNSLKGILTNTPIKLDDLYPEKFKEPKNKKTDYKIQQSRDSEKRKFDGFYKHAIAIYEFRAKIIISHKNEKNIENFTTICKKIKEDWDFRYYDSYGVRYKLNYLALVLCDTIPYLDKYDSLIELLITSFENKKENRISLRVLIAQKNSSIDRIKDYTYKVLDEIDNLVQDSTLPSSNRIDYYISLAKISKGLDKNISKLYFEKALEAVSEIDIEAQEQIKCLANLTELGIPKDNSHLAFEFARFVEFCYSRLDGYDNFPLEEGLKGVAFLDCSTVFTVICRWSHRYTAEVTEHILSVLKISINKNFLSPSIAGSFLPLNPYYWDGYVDNIKLLIEKFDILGDSNQKTLFINNVFRDLQINCSSHKVIKSIYAETKNGKFLSGETLSDFKNYVLFIEEIDKDKRREESKHKTNIKETPSVFKSLSILKDVDICSTSSINEALTKVKQNSKYSTLKSIDQFLNEIKSNCNPKEYINHLNAFIHLNPELVSLYSFEKAIKKRLDDWKAHPLVKEWKKHNFSKVLKLWFSEYNWDYGINYDGIRQLADAFSITDKELSDTVISILPEKIEELSATDLYQTISFIKERITQDENEELIGWILPRWNIKIKEDFADGLWNTIHAPSREQEEVIAKTIRFILGHPDKRIRWRGIHVLRRIVNTGNHKILNALINQQNSTTCNPFQHKYHLFFWISSKLYLWICIARLSEENPSIISKFKSQIYEESKNKELPHILILYFITQTLQNLIKYDESLFSEDEVIIVESLLVSKFDLIKSEKTGKKRRHNELDDDNRRFNFDSMDTLPYWYSNLGSCFNVYGSDVADIADVFISEKWGYVGNPNKDNHVEGDYTLTSNRQGGLPTIENVEKYFEYHSMNCAASILLETKPLKEDDSADWDSWENWLKSRTLTWKQFWLSDLRDPVPLNKIFWTSEINTFNKDWRDNIEEKIYDETLGLSIDSKTNTIIACGGYTRHFGDNYERFSVNSALVSTKTSEALLRALQSSKRSSDYRIPVEDERLEINQSDFQLIGWLKEINTDYEGLDKNDPFGKEISRHLIVFGREVKNLFDLKSDKYSKLTFHKSKIVSHYKSWNNTTERRINENLESEGSLLEVDVDFILEFLKVRNMSLIIKCTIERQLKEKEYNYDIPKNNSKLYLLNSNGEIKTIRGRNFKIR